MPCLARVSNGSVVNLLYKNQMGSLPVAAEYNQLVALLDSGAFTQSSYAVAAAEHEVTAVNIALVGLASTGLEYFAAA